MAQNKQIKSSRTVLVDKVLADRVYKLPFVKDALKSPTIRLVDVITSLLNMGLKNQKLFKQTLATVSNGKHNSSLIRRITALNAQKVELEKQMINVKRS